ncbi:MAG: tyrosine--tRNA ligase [Clostridiales bacterium]
MAIRNTFGLLEERGYIYQLTHEKEIQEAINGEQITFYLGIDPTADSLHIGHFFALMMFRYLQDAGHKGILVIGGATALIGDPSGKSDMRQLLTKEEVQHNLEEVKTLAKRFVKTEGDNPAIILNNADWINPHSYVDFMRDIGIHFNVNTMLATETYANRIKEGGLTFLEMGYMLMQSYDFVYLNRKYGCKLQIGGSDQWGNIVAGMDLGRKKSLEEEKEKDVLYGVTCPLLMTKEGKKMGKTESGTLWVAREKTTVFDFYQYFYNVNDKDTEMLLRLFTHVPTQEIIDLCKSDILKAKKKMAFEITKLVHGDVEANKVLEAVNSLFGESLNMDNVPKHVIKKELLQEGINILELLTITKFISSKSESRRMVQQGGISVNNEKIKEINHVVNLNDIKDSCILLKRGKKNFLKVTLAK